MNVVFSILEQKEPLFISQTVGDCFFLLFAREQWKNQIVFGE
jgi:hypothetical protein